MMQMWPSLCKYTPLNTEIENLLQIITYFRILSLYLLRCTCCKNFNAEKVSYVYINFVCTKTHTDSVGKCARGGAVWGRRKGLNGGKNNTQEMDKSQLKSVLSFAQNTQLNV